MSESFWFGIFQMNYSFSVLTDLQQNKIDFCKRVVYIRFLIAVQHVRRLTEVIMLCRNAVVATRIR